MVTAAKDSLSPGGFLHSGAFLLVDNNKNIRGKIYWYFKNWF